MAMSVGLDFKESSAHPALIAALETMVMV